MCQVIHLSLRLAFESDSLIPAEEISESALKIWTHNEYESRHSSTHGKRNGFSIGVFVFARQAVEIYFCR